MTRINRTSQTLTSLSLATALAAAYYLFFIPTIEKYPGFYAGTPLPPMMKTAWGYFTWDGQGANTITTFIFFLTPVILTSVSFIIIKRTTGAKKTVGLWGLTALMLIAMLIGTPDLGPVFIPAAVFLLAAALNETRNVSNDPS